MVEEYQNDRLKIVYDRLISAPLNVVSIQNKLVIAKM